MAIRDFHLNRLFEGSLLKLRVDAAYFSQSTRHDGEMGRLNETHLVRMLRDYLPPKIGIGTGFIVCAGKKPRQSPQCDIILYDTLNNVPLYQSEAWSIFPIEMVYGVIEVKSSANLTNMRKSFRNCLKIRDMAKEDTGDDNKSYLLQIPSALKKVQNGSYASGLAPRFFIFAYSGWKSVDIFSKNFRRLTRECDGAHIHGFCQLTEHNSLYTHHLAYRSVEDRCSSVSTGGFRHFLMNLPQVLTSMLPAHRFGLGFDQANLARYGIDVQVEATTTNH